MNTFQDHIVGFSVCNGKESLYIPLNHINSILNVKLPNQIPEQEIIDLFKELNDTKHYRYVYHNAKFDLAVFRTFLGFEMPAPYWDTLICSYIIYQKGGHSLKELYNQYIAVEDEGVNKFDTLFKGVTFDYIPLSIATVYAGKDAFMTFELFKWQERYLNQVGCERIKDVYLNIEVPLIPVLAQMFQYGVNINEGMLMELYKKYNSRQEIAKTAVYAEIEKNQSKIDEYCLKHPNNKLSNPINIDSPTQLSVLFYNILGYKTKAGKGTGVNELQEINTPLTQALLEHRKVAKLIDAFLVSLPKKIEPTTGKIHTSLNQYGAETGRFSSSNPNLQQIPSHGEGKEIRRIFGATKGNILLSSDFSQQEPRCLACLANEQGMQEAYRTGKDLYATMAAEIYNKPYEDCLEFYLDDNGKKTTETNVEGKKRRSSVKGILLGLMYGRGTASVAEQIHTTAEEAQKIIDDFFTAYPGIKSFMEVQQKIAKEKGYTETAWGRRRILENIQKEVYTFTYNDKRPIDFNPLLTVIDDVNTQVPQDVKDELTQKLNNSKGSYNKKKLIEKLKESGIDVHDNGADLAEANRQVVNSIIQGSASDITKRAMIAIGNNKELKDLGFKMLFPVHDEIIAECPFVNRKRCAELMSQLMIDAAKPNITVPMKCDAEAFFYWYGPDVDLDDSQATQLQFEEYCSTGVYKEKTDYSI